MRQQVRQGDVLLDPCDEPEGLVLVPIQGDRIVLAEGEETGHTHSVHLGDAVMLVSPSGARYLRVVKSTPLEHEEHPPIPLDLGPYRVVQDREYDDFGIDVSAD